MKVLIKKICSWPLPTTLFAILLFYIPFHDRYHRWLKIISKKIPQLQDAPSFFSASLSLYISDFLMLGIIFFSIRQIKKQQSLLKLSLNGKFLISFCAFIFLSIVLSPDGGKIWPYYYFLQISLPVLTFFILLETVEVKNHIELFFWILCIAACIEGMIVIKQYLVQHSIGLRHLGEVPQHYDFSPIIFVENKHRWIFDNIFHLTSPSVKILRPAGTFHHPNILGGFLGIVQFALYFLFVTTKKKTIRWSLILMICFQTLVLAITFSRAAIFGVIGGSFFFLCTLSYFSKMHKKALYLLIVLLVSHSLTWIILHEQLEKRGGIVQSNSTNRSSDSDRIYFSKMAWSMFKTHPFFGHGWRRYSLEMEKYDLEKNRTLQTVHNIYLLILVETGIFGLLAFFGFLISLLLPFRNLPLDPIAISMLSMLIFILFCGLFDHYWLLHQQGRLLLFFIPALIYSYANEKKRSLKFQNQSDLLLRESQ